jgi:hypothetical protein
VADWASGEPGRLRTFGEPEMYRAPDLWFAEEGPRGVVFVGPQGGRLRGRISGRSGTWRAPLSASLNSISTT